MTRVCRVATYPRVGREGVGMAAYELTRRLPYSTLYLTPRRPEPLLLPPARTSLVEVSVRDHVLPDRSAGRRRLWPAYLRKALAHAGFAAGAFPHMVRFRPHIVHIHSIQPYFLAVAARLIGARVMITFHGTDLYRIAGTPLFKLSMRIFDRVFYVSRAMESQLREVVDDRRLRYTPNGVDVERFSPNGNKREAVVFTAGVLKWQKGIDVLLEAFAAFLPHHPRWRLRIAGDGPLADKYKRYAGELGISHSVDWLGRLGQAELIVEYRRARVFVLASHTEGFPKVVLESMACATPVVATNVGSCAEVIGDAGAVVLAGDPRELERAMTQLVDGDDTWEQKSRRSLSRAAEYSWDRAPMVVSREMNELMEESKW